MATEDRGSRYERERGEILGMNFKGNNSREVNGTFEDHCRWRSDE